jgi:hypothetical protein
VAPIEGRAGLHQLTELLGLGGGHGRHDELVGRRLVVLESVRDDLGREYARPGRELGGLGLGSQTIQLGHHEAGRLEQVVK